LYLYQILQAICFCHQRRVMHRDLKPHNLLIDQAGAIKLADFGLARAVNVPMRAYTHEAKVLLGATRYGLGVDMWSVGCVFAELASKKILFQGDSEIDQMFCIFRHVITFLLFVIFPNAMLAYDPSQRISAKRLLKHEYFDDVDRGLLPAGNYDGSTLILGS
uniref:Protein kinase domain-containing protein n=1 Tax=Gongylonema pulchrum TaxID=637853 RepID=A0A183EVJ5_9BILA